MHLAEMEVSHFRKGNFWKRKADLLEIHKVLAVCSKLWFLSPAPKPFTGREDSRTLTSFTKAKDNLERSRLAHGGQSP